MTLEIENKTSCPPKKYARTANSSHHAQQHGFFTLLKDRSYPLVLGTKELVQLQIKVINLTSSTTLIALAALIIPIVKTPNPQNYPYYVKTAVLYSFLISIASTTLYI